MTPAAPLDLEHAQHAPASAVRSGGNFIGVWHVVISGFTQTLGHSNGVQSVWGAIRLAVPDCREADCLLLPWNANWPEIAEFIWQFRPADRPPRITVEAYSWGGGWGFPCLARELGKRGIDIEHAVLCDAVYRSPWRLLAWRSLTRRPKIVVPPNVREVSWFYQRTGLPMGHQVVAADSQATKIHDGVELPGVTHHYMDDQPAWRRKCLQVAGQT